MSDLDSSGPDLAASDATASDACPENFQTLFHRRWGHLSDPHVRALAWLLDAPDLLDPAAPQWQGRIASLGAMPPHTARWLAQLDETPGELQDWLGAQPFTRLGRYAEKLMAFYFRHQGVLVAHGLQVRGERNETIGEFDFLLKQGEALVHWEFATKFYLLESEQAASRSDPDVGHNFVGPNLADTLGAKIRKIMERQLALSQHPAAQAGLPMAVARAQALIKGWLFYPGRTPPARMPGISAPHCHGFWKSLSDFSQGDADGGCGNAAFMPLFRLSWLAPMQNRGEPCIGRVELLDKLRSQFARDAAPVLVAAMREEEGLMREIDRGFIVPDDWRTQATRRANCAG